MTKKELQQLSTHKHRTIKTAKELNYPYNVIIDLENANSIPTIDRIMVTARRNLPS